MIPNIHPFPDYTLRAVFVEIIWGVLLEPARIMFLCPFFVSSIFIFSPVIFYLVFYTVLFFFCGCFLYAGALQIHWLSIINSFVLVLILTVFLGIILLRVIKNDFTRYMDGDEVRTPWAR